MSDYPLEDLVRQAKSSFHTWALNIAMTAIIAQVPFLGAPIIKQIVSLIVSKILTILIDNAEFGAFVINTRILTSGEAKDYRQAVSEVLALPPDATKESWEAAERKANEAFGRLIRFTS